MPRRAEREQHLRSRRAVILSILHGCHLSLTNVTYIAEGCYSAPVLCVVWLVVISSINLRHRLTILQELQIKQRTTTSWKSSKYRVPAALTLVAMCELDMLHHAVKKHFPVFEQTQRTYRMLEREILFR